MLLNNILDTKHPEAGGGNVELRSREGCMPSLESNSIVITAFLLANGMSLSVVSLVYNIVMVPSNPKQSVVMLNCASMKVPMPSPV